MRTIWRATRVQWGRPLSPAQAHSAPLLLGPSEPPLLRPLALLLLPLEDCSGRPQPRRLPPDSVASAQPRPRRRPRALVDSARQHQLLPPVDSVGSALQLLPNLLEGGSLDLPRLQPQWVDYLVALQVCPVLSSSVFCWLCGPFDCTERNFGINLVRAQFLSYPPPH